MRFVLLAAVLAASVSVAEAAVIVTGFEYEAGLRAGTINASVSDFPAGGVFQQDDGRSPSSFAAVTGYGNADPVDFASGAAAAGNAIVLLTNSVSIDLVNDSGVTSQGALSSRIYGGGVGLALADFGSPDCHFADITNCGSFLGGPSELSQVAALQFEATLDGTTLFSGLITVDPTNGPQFSFVNLALTDFGLAEGNTSFLTWSETLLENIDLGVFSVGQTKSLEFNVSILVGSLVGVDSLPCAPTSCSIAQAGFGDPPGDRGGGIITYRSAPSSSSLALVGLTFEPADVVPVPPAFALFPLGLAALGAARRWGRKA